VLFKPRLCVIARFPARYGSQHGTLQLAHFLHQQASGVVAAIQAVRSALPRISAVAMKRLHVNALIDVFAFFAFLLLLSTGLLLKYQLVPGSGGLSQHGTGHRASERAVQLLWGWTRHEWGQIHYWIALTLLAILAFHVVLHWKWIVCTLRGKPSQASGSRLALGCVGLVFALLLFAAPLLSESNTVSRGELRESRSPPPVNGSTVPDGQNEIPTEERQTIRGSMTLRQIADERNIPVQEIVTALQLPRDTNVDENAGRLLRQHNLQMSDLRDWLAGRRASDNASHNL
jgi:hypothetical protein